MVVRTTIDVVMAKTDAIGEQANRFVCSRSTVQYNRPDQAPLSRGLFEVIETDNDIDVYCADRRLRPVFLLDPDDPGGDWKAGGGNEGAWERKSPSGVQGQSPPPPKWGSGAEPPETEQVLMIIKTFLAEMFSNKII